VSPKEVLRSRESTLKKCVRAANQQTPEVSTATGLPGATLTTLTVSLPEERLREIESGHYVDLARCGDEPLERRHRARNRALAEKRHQADHCEAAVVDLNLQLLGLPLVTLVLVEVEGIVQVERDGMRQERATLRVRENLE
jgi:hypothetical protein